MKKPKLSSRFATVVFALCVTFTGLQTVAVSRANAATEQKADEKVPPAMQIVVPYGLSADDVRAAIMMGAGDRGWMIKKHKDGEVVIHLIKRRHDSTLTLKFDTTKINVYSDSWILNRDGSRRKREEPRGWLKYLRESIVKHLNTELARK